MGSTRPPGIPNSLGVRNLAIAQNARSRADNSPAVSETNEERGCAMYSKPTLLKLGSFERLTKHSRPIFKDRDHRRRPRHILL
ncbi:lasso RiPP family leader peptide-containing protein [Actinosynnema sp. NPDC050436]|uniref:lasso RiPP family leader peptide-containing protein n=1 Tax=Actinosynnema sp. NPDC050436 TaxID=3155659 RepID=UPI0033F839B2